MTVRGRYAPSPTGDLHLGNASTALLSWLSVRSRGGLWVMRLEDLDRARVREGTAQRILDDLRWLGLDWDEGYDVGGPHAPYAQSERLELYREAFEKLRTAGRAYPCFCSRRDIASAASAPQAPGDELPYPGTCAKIPASEAERRIADGKRPAWRFRVSPKDPTSFKDLVRGKWKGERPTDFVVWRSDGTPAYQLAVVVDDDAMAITEVVRGDDLLTSTLRQLALYGALGFEPPGFGHVPLLLGEDGVRLSKRHAGTSIAEMREAGWKPERVVGRIAELLGLKPGTPRAMAEGFQLKKVAVREEGVRV